MSRNLAVAGLRVLLLGSFLVAIWEGPGVTAPPPGLTLMGSSALAVCSGLLLQWVEIRLSSLVGILVGLFLCGWSLITSTQTLDPFLSQVSVVGWLAGLGVLSATALCAREPADWRQTAHLFLLLLNAVSLYSLFLALRGGGWARASFTNPDCFSVLPLAGAFLALGLAAGSTGKGTQSGYLLASLAAQIGTLLMTGSRAGLAGLAVGLLGFIGLGRKRFWGSARALLALLSPVLVGVVAVALLRGPEAFSKLHSLSVGQDRIGFTSRIDVLRVGVPLGLEKPWLGQGPGTFHLAYQSRRPRCQGEDYMNVAHNDYVQILVEMGLAGFFAWLALLGVAFVSATRAARADSKAELAGTASAILALSVYCLGNFAVPVPADLMTVSLVLALGMAGPDRLAPSALSRLAGILLIAAGLLGLFRGDEIRRNNQALGRALALEQKLEWIAGLEALEQVGNGADVRVHLLRARLNERQGLLARDDGRQVKALEDLEKAHHLSPLNLEVTLRLARILETQGMMIPANRLLEEARQQAPHTEYVLLLMVRNLVLQGRLEEAARELATVSTQADPIALGELVALLEENQEGRGVSLLKSWLENQSSPSLPRAARRAGDFARLRKRDRAAREFYRLGSPHDRACKLGLARLEADAELRLSLYQELIDQGPDDAIQQEALQLWAQMLTDRGQCQQVLKRLEPALLRHPENVALRLLLARCFEKVGRVSEAARVLEEGFDFGNAAPLKEARQRLP